VYSASLVVAVFMLGLGVGSYFVGRWADGRYPTLSADPQLLLRTYAVFEGLIGIAGLAVSLLLPRLAPVSALVSAYSRDPSGWYVLSTASYLARAGIAAALLMPATSLMGGTLTLLIRHLVRADPAVRGWRIATLYGINTAGAAAGAFLTDFWLVPAIGLQLTQAAAAGLNLIAGGGAWLLAARLRLDASTATAEHRTGRGRKRGRVERGAMVEQSRRTASSGSVVADLHDSAPDGRLIVRMTGLSLGIAGFAAMGMEIVWFRHFTILLGGFRAVFSLLLTVILVGLGVGSLLAGFVERRTSRPAAWLIAVQGLFAAFTAIGLAASGGQRIESALDAEGARSAATQLSVDVGSPLARAALELWFNVRPMLGEIALPALLMGFTFPLANAVIQRAEASVGRRAGALYLANTAGAVCGSLAAGFYLLPRFGLQMTATVLMAAALLAAFPLVAVRGLALGGSDPAAGRPRAARTMSRLSVASAVAGAAALVLWVRLP
jgi:spermidine synthase